jgi:DNA repair protein RecO
VNLPGNQPFFLTTQAVVLRTWTVREADVWADVFTEELGIIQLNVPGIRKSVKRDKLAWEPGSVSRIELYNKEKISLRQADMIFRPELLNGDYEGLLFLSYLLEVFRRFLPENTPEPGAWKLLYGALDLLNDTKPGLALLVFVKLRLFQLLGNLPDLQHCSHCGQPAHRFQWARPWEEIWCEDCTDEPWPAAICEWMQAAATRRWSQLPDSSGENFIALLSMVDEALTEIGIAISGRQGAAERQFYQWRGVL